MNKKKIISGVIIAFVLICVSLLFTQKLAEVNTETNEKSTFFQRISEKREIKKLNKNISKAKKAINKKKYDKALEILSKEALNNKDNKEVKALYTMVNNYQKALKSMEGGRIKVAKDLLEEIDTSYGTYRIGEDINDLKTKIKAKEAEKEEINSQIGNLNNMIEEKKYDEAKSLIGVLKKKNLDEYQKSTIKTVDKNIDETLAKIEEEKRLEAERQKAEAERLEAERKRAEQERLEAEKRRAEEQRIREEDEARAAAQNSSQNSGSSNNYNNSSNSNNNSNYNSGSGSYYVAAGNRYYHKTPSCKFLEGAPTTLVSDVSNKFPCNCVKY